MGSSPGWHPSACSRICFALATLVCMVDAHAAVGDHVMVAAFAASMGTIKSWFLKPDPFDKVALLLELCDSLRTSGLQRDGTRLCSAVYEAAVSELGLQAQQTAGAIAAPP